MSVIGKPRKGRSGPGIGSKRHGKEKCQAMLHCVEEWHAWESG